MANFLQPPSHMVRWVFMPQYHVRQRVSMFAMVCALGFHVDAHELDIFLCMKVYSRCYSSLFQSRRYDSKVIGNFVQELFMIRQKQVYYRSNLFQVWVFREGVESVVTQQRCSLTLQPDPSDGQGSIPDRALALQCLDKGLLTRFGLLNFAIPALGAKYRNFTFTFLPFILKAWHKLDMYLQCMGKDLQMFPLPCYTEATNKQHLIDLIVSFLFFFHLKASKLTGLLF